MTTSRRELLGQGAEECLVRPGRLAVRGAPALGVAGALGVALAARIHADDPVALADAVRRVETARPTAVNLSHGVRLAAAALAEGFDAVLAAALALREAPASLAKPSGEVIAHHLVQAVPLLGPEPALIATPTTSRWYLDRQGPPDSLHATVSAGNAPMIEEFLSDLRSCVAAVGKSVSGDRSTDYATLE